MPRFLCLGFLLRYPGRVYRMNTNILRLATGYLCPHVSSHDTKTKARRGKHGVFLLADDLRLGFFKASDPSRIYRLHLCVGAQHAVQFVIGMSIAQGVVHRNDQSKPG